MSKRVILAAAGAGKTEMLVEEALATPGKRVLLTTYTKRNANEISNRLIKRCGAVPPHVRVETWFSFLLRDAIKPYQSVVTTPFRTRSINFDAKRNQFASKIDVEKYYFDRASNLYQDAVADLACVINSKSEGKSIQRLEQILDIVLIDEMQDLVGYDLDFIDFLLASQLEVVLVGDPRQYTYASNNSQKHRQYRGFGMYKWIDDRRSRGAVEVLHMNWSYRCSSSICEFADAIFPDQPATEARQDAMAEHRGIFLVAEEHLVEYVAKFRPMLLRWNRKTRISGDLQAEVANIGDVKGCTFDRVVVFPTQPMLKYLRTRNLDDSGGRQRFYVAVTRAKYSVAFVVANSRVISEMATHWRPDSD